MIVGTWELWKGQEYRNSVLSSSELYDSGNSPITIVFKSNGTGSFTQTTSRDTKVDTFTYRVIGDSIVYTLDDDGLNGEFIIEKLTQDELVYYFEYHTKTDLYKDVYYYAKRK